MKHLIKGREDAVSHWPPPDFEKQWSSSLLKEIIWDFQFCKSIMSALYWKHSFLYPCPLILIPFPETNLSQISQSLIYNQWAQRPFLCRLPSAKIMYHGWKKIQSVPYFKRKCCIWLCCQLGNGQCFAKLFFGTLLELVLNLTSYFANNFQLGIIRVSFKNEMRYIWFCN